VRRQLLTHAHIDHVGGTRAFPMSGVYASPQTSTLLEGEMPLDAYKAFMPAFDAEFDELAEIGTRQVTHLVTDAAQLTPRIEVLPAAGHTEGDLMALIADVDVLFAGDLCFFGVTPLAFQGDPSTWADVLDAVADLAELIVPGHGPVGGEQEVRQLQQYLRCCVDVAQGDTPGIPPGPWDTWPERDPRDAINVERAEMLARGENRLPPAMLRAMGFA
jgi:cyclase